MSGHISPEMEKVLVEAQRQEELFWFRQGFPIYHLDDKNSGIAHPAHLAWVGLVVREGFAFNSPMARKMFILGWLVRERDHK